MQDGYVLGEAGAQAGRLSADHRLFPAAAPGGPQWGLPLSGGGAADGSAPAGTGPAGAERVNGCQPRRPSASLRVADGRMIAAAFVASGW